jgi:hypothetical protein
VPLHPLLRHLFDMAVRASRAELKEMNDRLNTPAGINHLVLAWSLSYFTSGDYEHALSELERVYRLLPVPGQDSRCRR